MAIAALLFLTLLGGALRFFRLSNQSFWTDEVSSVTTARTPLNQITQISASLNNCPPTYFLALRPIIGESNDHIEFRARSLSALAGTLSIPLFVGVIYAWQRRWGTALLAGLLLAINPLHLWYSQEVRAYALMLLFGLITMLAYERALRNQSKHGWIWWMAYSVAGLVAVAIHKTGLVFPAICILWHAWQAFRARGPLRALWTHSVVAIGTIIILLAIKSSPPSKEYGRPSSILELAYTGLTFLGGYSFGPSLTEIQNYGPAHAVSQHWFQVSIVVVVLFLFAAAFVLRLRSFMRAKETGLLALGVGVVALGALISAFPYNVRYALPGLIGLLGLVAMLRQSGLGLQLLLSRLVIVAVILIGLWADGQWFFNAAYRKGDSRAVAQWLRGNQDHIRAWTVVPDYLAISIQWYLEPFPEIRDRFMPPKESQTTSFPPVPDVLIVGRRHHLIQPDQIIASYQGAAGKIDTNQSFAGFELYARVPGTGTDRDATGNPQP